MAYPDGATFEYRISSPGVVDRFLRIYLSSNQAIEVAKLLGGVVVNVSPPACAVGIEGEREIHTLLDDILHISTSHPQLDEIVTSFWSPGRAAYQRWRRAKKKEEKIRLENRDSLLFDDDVLKMKHLPQGRPTTEKKLKKHF